MGRQLALLCFAALRFAALCCAALAPPRLACLRGHNNNPCLPHFSHTRPTTHASQQVSKQASKRASEGIRAAAAMLHEKGSSLVHAWGQVYGHAPGEQRLAASRAAARASTRASVQAGGGGCVARGLALDTTAAAGTSARCTTLKLSRIRACAMLAQQTCVAALTERFALFVRGGRGL